MAQSNSMSSDAGATHVSERSGVGAGISPKRYTNLNAGTPLDPRVRHDGQPKGSGGSKDLNSVQAGDPKIQGKPWMK